MLYTCLYLGMFLPILFLCFVTVFCYLQNASIYYNPYLLRENLSLDRCSRFRVEECTDLYCPGMLVISCLDVMSMEIGLIKKYFEF